MVVLLRLKHWQLFLLTWGVTLVINFSMVSDPVLMITLFPLMIVFWAIGLLGWIWAISTTLQPLLPSGVSMNVRQFKMLFLVPVVYALVIVGAMVEIIRSAVHFDTSLPAFLSIIVVLHIFSFICIVFGIRFAAKTMKSVELGRMARFPDYMAEFFLIWFSMIGIWILQPRLNKLAAESDQKRMIQD